MEYLTDEINGYADIADKDVMTEAQDLSQTYLFDILKDMEKHLSKVKPSKGIAGNDDGLQVLGSMLNLVRSMQSDSNVEKHLKDLNSTVKAVMSNYE